MSGPALWPAVIATAGALLGSVSGGILGIVLERRREKAALEERYRQAQVEAIHEVQVRLRDLNMVALRIFFSGGLLAATDERKAEFLAAASSLTIYGHRVLDGELRRLAGEAQDLFHDLFREPRQGEEADRAVAKAQGAANVALEHAGVVVRSLYGVPLRRPGDPAGGDVQG